MNLNPIRVASLGLGWWSDVLADGIIKADGIEVVSCFTRSKDKREAFAKKYNCSYADSYEQLLADDTIDAIINTTPNNTFLYFGLICIVSGVP